MTKVKIFNMKAEEVGMLDLSDHVFGVEYHESVIHDVVVAQNANARQGTKSTLSRSEVRGKAKKPWNQKHTGNARHGSKKAPQWTGGGVAFAPKPRDFSKKINKQVKVLAFLSALSKKVADNEIVVVDKFESTGRTKEIVAFLDAFKLNRKTLIVLPEKNEEVMRAANNIQNASVVVSDLLNTKEIATCEKLVLTVEAIKNIEEACE